MATAACVASRFPGVSSEHSPGWSAVHLLGRPPGRLFHRGPAQRPRFPGVRGAWVMACQGLGFGSARRRKAAWKAALGQPPGDAPFRWTCSPWVREPTVIAVDNPIHLDDAML